jgi:hypothetical protein
MEGGTRGRESVSGRKRARERASKEEEGGTLGNLYPCTAGVRKYVWPPEVMWGYWTGFGLAAPALAENGAGPLLATLAEALHLLVTTALQDAHRPITHGSGDGQSVLQDLVPSLAACALPDVGLAALNVEDCNPRDLVCWVDTFTSIVKMGPGNYSASLPDSNLCTAMQPPPCRVL